MRRTKSLFFLMLIFAQAPFFVAAQDGASFDDDAFFADFGDDDLFGDDVIEEISDVSAHSDLSRGILFETGAVKVGGSLTASLSTNTVIFSEDKDSLGDNIYNTTLVPELSALLSVDARPTRTLRIYTKFGLAYPFVSTARSTANSYLIPNPPLEAQSVYTTVSTSVTDWFTLKELFTDFSVRDTAFFRFGVHTVTWGTGYFFSPVSDLINTSAIDPQNPDKQVDGSLNLRTQIVFPNTQNCLWFYVVPSTDFHGQTAESYARQTALAGKADVVFGGWEFGLGGFWKYQHAPKAMLTASGSIQNVSIFGEFLYSYGADSEWSTNTHWDDKTSIVQVTAGVSHYWKTPKIMLAGQYYYDSNDVDPLHKYVTHGHNAAVMVTFGRLFGTTKCTASLFEMVNIGKKELTKAEKAALASLGGGFSINAVTSQYTISVSPIDELTLGMGPVITIEDFETLPTVSLRFTATLGGGKF